MSSAIAVIFGSVVCPALDALVLLLKTKMPSMKKKGAVSTQVKALQTTIWDPLRDSLKRLAKEFEPRCSKTEPK
jgi:hypothetical protein